MHPSPSGRPEQFTEALRHEVAAEARPLQLQNVVDRQLGRRHVAPVEGKYAMVGRQSDAVAAAGLQFETPASGRWEKSAPLITGSAVAADDLDRLTNQLVVCGDIRPRWPPAYRRSHTDSWR